MIPRKGYRMNCNQTLDKLQKGTLDACLCSLYGEHALPAQRARYAEAIRAFADRFGGEREITLFSVPGRSELSGNHTDHNAGRALAAAVDLDVIAVASPASSRTVTLLSAGYGEAVLVRNRHQSGLLVTRSDGLRDAADLLYTMGCTRLDYLLVGKGDPTDAGGLAHLLRQVKVGQVLVADSAVWTAGASGDVTTLSYADRLSVGEVAWTYHGDDWQLDTPDTHLTVGGNNAATTTVPSNGTPIQYLAPAKDWRQLLWL